MLTGRTGLQSFDRAVRGDAVRRIVRRDIAERHLSEDEISALLGISRARLRKMLEFGEPAGVRSSDDVLLAEVTDSNALLEEKARLRGMRLVPDVQGTATSGDVLSAAASAMGQAAKLVAEVTSALPDGIDPGERRAILSKIDETRRALNALESRVDVQPLRSTR